MNPTAIIFWALLGIVGYLLGGTTTCLIFVAGGLLISLAVDILRR